MTAACGCRCRIPGGLDGEKAEAEGGGELVQLCDPLLRLLLAFGDLRPVVPTIALAPAPAELTERERVVFEWEPPPRRYGPRRGPELLTDEQEKALRSQPGKWARIREFKGPTSGHSFRKRWIDRCGHEERTAERFPATHWEVEARKFPNGQSAVWARFWPPEMREDEP